MASRRECFTGMLQQLRRSPPKCSAAAGPALAHAPAPAGQLPSHAPPLGRPQLASRALPRITLAHSLSAYFCVLTKTSASHVRSGVLIVSFFRSTAEKASGRRGNRPLWAWGLCRCRNSSQSPERPGTTQGHLLTLMSCRSAEPVSNPQRLWQPLSPMAIGRLAHFVLVRKSYVPNALPRHFLLPRRFVLR